MRRLFIFCSMISLMTSLSLAQETKPSPTKPAEAPPTVDQILEKFRGFEAVASLITGGVRTLDSNGMAYMDLDA